MSESGQATSNVSHHAVVINAGSIIDQVAHTENGLVKDPNAPLAAMQQLQQQMASSGDSAQQLQSEISQLKTALAQEQEALSAVTASHERYLIDI